MNSIGMRAAVALMALALAGGCSALSVEERAALKTEIRDELRKELAPKPAAQSSLSAGQRAGIERELGAARARAAVKKQTLDEKQAEVDALTGAAAARFKNQAEAERASAEAEWGVASDVVEDLERLLAPPPPTLEQRVATLEEKARTSGGGNPTPATCPLEARVTELEKLPQLVATLQEAARKTAPAGDAPAEPPPDAPPPPKTGN